MALQYERRRRATEVEHARVARSADQIRANCVRLAGFVREAWHVMHPATPYVHNWHVDLICEHLEAITHGLLLARGLENRMLFNVPPGSLKSYLISVFWQAWEWGPAGMPHTQWLTTTYREDYARRDSRRTRDLILSDWYQQLWGGQFTLLNEGEQRFDNDHRGFRWCVPFGSLTGGRADRVIIDDPHSVDTAESDTDRETITRRFREAVPHRVNDPKASAIVLVMQRLHGNDVTGVVQQLRLPWIQLVLPMEFEIERRCWTPIGRDPRTQEGELFFPERWSREVVDRMKGTATQPGEMTAYAWASQMQQRPTAREGGDFPRGCIDVVDAAPAEARRVRGWDLAATSAKQNTTTGPAWSVGVKIAEHKGVFYVEDVRRMRGSAAEVERLIKQTAIDDGEGVCTSIPQDPGQAGKAQVDAYAKLLVGHNVHFSPESGDKRTRSQPFAAQAEVGNVKVVRGLWNDAYLEELYLSPGGPFMDQVDASSRAFAKLLTMRGPVNNSVAAPVQVGAAPRVRI